MWLILSGTLNRWLHDYSKMILMLNLWDKDSKAAIVTILNVLKEDIFMTKEKKDISSAEIIEKNQIILKILEKKHHLFF